MKHPKDGEGYYWFLFVICHFGDIYALLGSTKENIDEPLTKTVLGPWLQLANITGVGMEDFEYSSGKCKDFRVRKVIRVGAYIVFSLLLFTPPIVVIMRVLLNK